MCLKKRIFFTVFAIYFVDKKYEVNSWIDIGINFIYFGCIFLMSNFYTLSYNILDIKHLFYLIFCDFNFPVRSWPQNTAEIRLPHKLPVIRYLACQFFHYEHTWSKLIWKLVVSTRLVIFVFISIIVSIQLVVDY